ncbi:MAG: D-alanyl-D-alanine carboxypeptidase [Spirochaetia bacterium]|nr:D-alanyl-D-alanine carboxypeptidase [Spirochaetia bacterium]
MIKRTVKRIIKIIILAAILFGIVSGIRACVAPPKEQTPEIPYSDVYNGFSTVPEPVLQCKAAVLMDYDTGTVLYTKNAEEIIPPASMTKLMTTYLVMEKVKSGELDLDQDIVVPPEADFERAPYRSSLMYIRAGQRIKLRDLLTGLMVTSGNDAAMAVAMLVGGSRDACVEMMNQKAKQLGFSSFVFTDPAGYEETNQVNALEFCQFCRIYVQNFIEYLDVLTNQEAFKMGSRSINNSNDLLGRYAGVDGLKTGYIDESGYNISLTAERDGMRLVAVIMGIKAKDIMNAKLMRMEEGASLLSYGFHTFRTFFPVLPAPVNVPVFGCASDSVPVAVAGNEQICIPYSQLYKLSWNVSLAKGIKRAAAGDQVGSCTVSLDGNPLAIYPLVAEEGTGQGSLWRRLTGSIKALGQKNSALNFSLAFPR